MSSNFPELVFNETDDFTADRLNKAMQVLDQRLRALEPFTPSWEAAVNELRAFGLARLNDAIVPTLQQVQDLAELGFLIADSNTTATLVAEENTTFVITNGSKRDLFTPTPFLVATREATPNDYAVLRLVSYDKTNGELIVTVKTIVGSAGPHSDWWIGPLAGNALAAQSYFSQIQTAKNDVLAAKAIVIANSAQASTDLSQSIANLAAINAAKDAALAAAAQAQLWDPTNYALKTYVDGKITDLTAGAEAALNTFVETAAALHARLRVDINNQGLTDPQKQNARTNAGLGTVSVKNIATVAEIKNNTNAGAVTVDNAWTAAGFYNIGDSGSGNLNVDCNNGFRQYARLTGNITVNFLNAKDGGPIELVLYQDGTGGRTVSWNTNVKWPDGIAPTITTGAGQIAVAFSGVYFSAYAYWLGAGWKIA